ncbi:hypothetical protein B0H16DRAFT_1455085 [Mycena metata]|uniref:Uncharacterized protein n=1 Tax=Mycena metata TaxID=1033252 RepID=A0AAD7JH99_9AGAR|nr:hypothetical protein B0H16DRAFT_1455085 [Mycena metata]
MVRSTTWTALLFIDNEWIDATQLRVFLRHSTPQSIKIESDALPTRLGTPNAFLLERQWSRLGSGLRERGRGSKSLSDPDEASGSEDLELRGHGTGDSKVAVHFEEGKSAISCCYSHLGCKVTRGARRRLGTSMACIWQVSSISLPGAVVGESESKKSGNCPLSSSKRTAFAVAARKHCSAFLSRAAYPSLLLWSILTGLWPAPLGDYCAFGASHNPRIDCPRFTGITVPSCREATVTGNGGPVVLPILWSVTVTVGSVALKKS